MIKLRRYDGKVREDKRESYSFVLPDGRIAETKAESWELAKQNIENTLGVQLKEAA